jgi:hypothetical protein
LGAAGWLALLPTFAVLEALVQPRRFGQRIAEVLLHVLALGVEDVAVQSALVSL